jgi:hypothetical protein
MSARASLASSTLHAMAPAGVPVVESHMRKVLDERARRLQAGAYGEVTFEDLEAHADFIRSVPDVNGSQERWLKAAVERLVRLHRRYEQAGLRRVSEWEGFATYLSRSVKTARVLSEPNSTLQCTLLMNAIRSVEEARKKFDCGFAPHKQMIFEIDQAAYLIKAESRAPEIQQIIEHEISRIMTLWAEFEAPYKETAEVYTHLMAWMDSLAPAVKGELLEKEWPRQILQLADSQLARIHACWLPVADTDDASAMFLTHQRAVADLRTPTDPGLRLTCLERRFSHLLEAWDLLPPSKEDQAICQTMGAWVNELGAWAVDRVMDAGGSRCRRFQERFGFAEQFHVRQQEHWQEMLPFITKPEVRKRFLNLLSAETSAPVPTHMADRDSPHRPSSQAPEHSRQPDSKRQDGRRTHVVTQERLEEKGRSLPRSALQPSSQPRPDEAPDHDVTLLVNVAFSSSTHSDSHSTRSPRDQASELARQLMSQTSRLSPARPSTQPAIKSGSTADMVVSGSEGSVSRSTLSSLEQASELARQMRPFSQFNPVPPTTPRPASKSPRTHSPVGTLALTSGSQARVSDLTSRATTPKPSLTPPLANQTSQSAVKSGLPTSQEQTRRPTSAPDRLDHATALGQRQTHRAASAPDGLAKSPGWYAPGPLIPVGTEAASSIWASPRLSPSARQPEGISADVTRPIAQPSYTDSLALFTGVQLPQSAVPLSSDRASDKPRVQTPPSAGSAARALSPHASPQQPAATPRTLTHSHTATSLHALVRQSESVPSRPGTLSSSAPVTETGSAPVGHRDLTGSVKLASAHQSAASSSTASSLSVKAREFVPMDGQPASSPSRTVVTKPGSAAVGHSHSIASVKLSSAHQSGAGSSPGSTTLSRKAREFVSTAYSQPTSSSPSAALASGIESVSQLDQDLAASLSSLESTTGMTSAATPGSVKLSWKVREFIPGGGNQGPANRAEAEAFQRVFGGPAHRPAQPAGYPKRSPDFGPMITRSGPGQLTLSLRTSPTSPI